jgi:uncharacterized damage-inducible protein DinB
MTTARELLGELEQEAPVTRRALERIPADKLTWRPHEKSMTLGQLGFHIAALPGAIAEMAMKSPCPAAPIPRPQPSSAEEILSEFDGSVDKARTILGDLDDSLLSATWKLVAGEREILAIPRKDLLRSILLNHWYHHRGQLTVYLRQVGAKVPAVYGSSADETPF